MSRERRSMPVAADLYADAEAAAARTGWSTEQQLEHWIRLGRVIERRVASAVTDVQTGAVTWGELTSFDRYAVNGVIDTGIETVAQAVELSSLQLTRGYPVVALDDSGALVRYHPDGTTELVDPT